MVMTAVSELYIRPGTIDSAIRDEVFGTGYFPDLIDYTDLRNVIDLGAHAGYFSRYVKGLSPDAHIKAVEPMPDNIRVCAFNLAGYSNIVLYSGRVAYKWVNAVLLLNQGNTGGNSFVPDNDPHIKDWQRIYNLTVQEATLYPVMTLEVVADDMPEIDLLKVDIEGAEFDILLNAPMETLTRCKWIVGEYHCGNGDFDEIIKRLLPAFELRERRHSSGNYAPGGNGLGLFCFERRDGE